MQPLPTDPATVHALVAQQAAARADAIYALSTDAAQAPLRFGALREDRDAVAAWLQSLGSQPGDVLSVVMPKMAAIQSMALITRSLSDQSAYSPDSPTPPAQPSPRPAG